MNFKISSKNLFVYFLVLYSIFYILAPSFVFAQRPTTGEGIWKGAHACLGRSPETGSCTTYNDDTCNISKGGCDFCSAVVVGQNIINYLFEIAIPLGVGMIVYGALRMIANFGNAQYIEAGKKLMTNAVIGITIALASWAIINTIMHLIAGNASFPWNTIEC